MDAEKRYCEECGQEIVILKKTEYDLILCHDCRRKILPKEEGFLARNWR